MNKKPAKKKAEPVPTVGGGPGAPKKPKKA